MKDMGKMIIMDLKWLNEDFEKINSAKKPYYKEIELKNKKRIMLEQILSYTARAGTDIKNRRL